MGDLKISELPSTEIVRMQICIVVWPFDFWELISSMTRGWTLWTK